MSQQDETERLDIKHPVDEIEWRDTEILWTPTKVILYDENPPRWWQFWKPRWLQSPTIASYDLDQHDSDTIPTFTIKLD